MPLEGSCMTQLLDSNMYIQLAEVNWTIFEMDYVMSVDNSAVSGSKLYHF
jgi:hypothetical protein